MGRGHGGSRGSSPNGGVSNATMQGYSRTLAKTVASREAEIRNERLEHTSVYDENGNELFRAVGTDHDTPIDTKTTPNNIVTHNHPGLGGSLSKGDIVNYTFWNAKEIRATDRNYTYSLKRPKEGWKSGTEKAYNKAKSIVDRADKAYFNNYKGNWETADRRLTSTYQHRVNKEFARIMGYSYTKQRNP